MVHRVIVAHHIEDGPLIRDRVSLLQGVGHLSEPADVGGYYVRNRDVRLGQGELNCVTAAESRILTAAMAP
jgi:hypothetical protein